MLRAVLGLSESPGDVTTRPRTRAWILVEPDRPAPRVFGLTGEERLRRSLAQAGVARVDAGPEPRVSEDSDLLLLRGDVVYDERLLPRLLESGEVLLETAAGPVGRGNAVAARLLAPGAERRGRAVAALRGSIPSQAAADEAGLKLVRPDDLVPPYDAKLRKRRPAWLLPLRDGATREVEQELFDASYKGITDFVTKWLWPWPALRVTRALAASGVSPNAVTLASWVLVVAATWAFAQGAFASGLLAAWAMTFLDTVDGKLARVTLRSTRIGHLLDHGLDLAHPPIWYFFWAQGLVPQPDWLPLALWVVLGGYLAGRLIEGIFLAFLGMEIHCWRPADARFRLVTARRNPNLVLLTAGALAGRADLGFAAVAVWSAASVAFHVGRLGMALVERGRRGAVQSFEEQPLLPGGPVPPRAGKLA
jgi:phosphatidylglycerophosphate synthase